MFVDDAAELVGIAVDGADAKIDVVEGLSILFVFID